MARAETDSDDGAGVPIAELSYTDASAELDDIVQFFEQREVDVDQLVARLVRATALIEELDTRLRRTQLQVEQLAPRLTAVLSERDAADMAPPTDTDTDTDTDGNAEKTNADAQACDPHAGASASDLEGFDEADEPDEASGLQGLF